MQKKNLVIFHLESVNKIVFDTRRRLFPNLNKMSGHCDIYNNYFSTATSTIMVIADLFYQDTHIFESSDCLEAIDNSNKNIRSAFRKLEDEGYKTKNLFYSFEDDRPDSLYNLGNSVFIEEEEEYCNELQNFTNSDQPFALFISDGGGHIGYRGKRIPENIKNGVERTNVRCGLLDRSFGKLIEILTNKKCMDNTVIVIYGDHGDDYWGHGFHAGYTHALEPFSGLINCPLMIYDASHTYTEHDDLINTTDLFDLIFSRLQLTDMSSAREYCFARNLFANQKMNINKFNKGYMVANQRYCLIVSHKGLEMYMKDVDPYNACNLLDFFTLKGSEVKFRWRFKYVLSTHFSNFMSEDTISDVRDNFVWLRSNLYKEVLSTYKENKKVKKEMKFNKIRYREKYIIQFLEATKIFLYKKTRGRNE